MGKTLTIGISCALSWFALAGTAQAEPLTGTGCVEMGLHGDHAIARQQAGNAAIVDALRRIHVPDPQTEADRVIMVPRAKVPRLLKDGWLGPVEILREEQMGQDLCVTVQFTLDAATASDLARSYGQPVGGVMQSRKQWSSPSTQNQPMVMTERELTGSPESLQTAQARQESNVQVVFGERTWITSGRTDFNFGNLGGSPNIVSELNWDHLQSTIQSVHMDVIQAQRFLLLVEGGGSIGGVHGGTMKDSDFSGDNRTSLFSESQSRASTGNVWFVTVDVGTRLARAATTDERGNPRWALDGLVGYQHWRENYQASQGVQTQSLPQNDPDCPFISCPAPLGLFPNQGPGINETYVWDALRIGGQYSASPLSRLSVRVRGFYIPYSALSMKDFHFFRGLGSPFITGHAFGGSGFQGSVAVAWTIWRTLALEVGYQYWQMTSGSGAVTFFDSNQLVTSVQPLNPVHSSRQGITVGLNFSF